MKLSYWVFLWRWTGYNMVFFLFGLQNIEYSVYEAAKIDGASAIQTFLRLLSPLLKLTILLIAIMSTNGTLQLFDESVNFDRWRSCECFNLYVTLHIIYVLSIKANFGHAAKMSFFITVEPVLAFIQMRVG